jgi:geranylgeranyl pyrophosphate synthase
VLRELLERTGSLDATRDAAKNLVERAKAALAPLPAGPGRELLSLMADAVIDRAF